MIRESGALKTMMVSWLQMMRYTSSRVFILRVDLAEWGVTRGQERV